MADSQLCTPASYSVRDYSSTDFPHILRLEKSCFEFPWDEADFCRVLVHRWTRVRTIQDDRGMILAYCIYQEHPDCLHLLSLATSPDFRKIGCGRSLLQHMKRHLATNFACRYIQCEVRETNLPAQQFFRACGFRAIEIEEDFYQNVVEAAYCFRYWHTEDHLVRR